jgi:hypothetical protein
MHQVEPQDATFLYIEGENRHTHATTIWLYDPACTSSEHMAPLELFSKRHFSARTFSNLARILHKFR